MFTKLYTSYNVLTVSLFLLMASFSVTLQAKEALQIAIMPMEDPTIDSQLRSYIVDLKKYRVEPASMTAEVILSAREDLHITCKRKKVSCLSKLGRLAGVDFFLVAQAKKKTLHLKLVSVNEVKVKNVVVMKLGEGRKRLSDMQLAVFQLLAPEEIYAEVNIQSSVQNAEVYVDGVATAKIPLERALKLPLGKHTIEIKSKGYKTYTSEVVLTLKQSLMIQAALIKGGEGDAAQGWSKHPIFTVPATIGGLMVVGGLVATVGGFGFGTAMEMQNWKQECWGEFGLISDKSRQKECLADGDHQQEQDYARVGHYVGIGGLSSMLVGGALILGGWIAAVTLVPEVAEEDLKAKDWKE